MIEEIFEKAKRVDEEMGEMRVIGRAKEVPSMFPREHTLRRE